MLTTDIHTWLDKNDITPLRDWLAQEEATLLGHFIETGKAWRYAHRRSDVIDHILRTSFEHLFAALPIKEQPTLIAIGGYGRRELAPHSDIDILILLPKESEETLERVRDWLQYLWDCNLHISHAIRTEKECLELANTDLNTRTSLLDRRHLAGPHAAYETFSQHYQKQVIHGQEGDFMIERLKERETRLTKHGHSRYLLEPNIKDGKGGLRDLHLLWWMAAHSMGLQRLSDLAHSDFFTPHEYKSFTRAYRRLLQLRIWMHAISQRSEDRLTFDLQQELSRRMGYEDKQGLLAVEQCMRHYYRTAREVGQLTRIICASLSTKQAYRHLFPIPSWLQRSRNVDGFHREGRWLFLPDNPEQRTNPTEWFRLIATAQHHELDIHPSALRIMSEHADNIRELRNSPHVIESFLSMLDGKNPGRSLRQLHEVRVFGKFLPDFGRVAGLMQFDMYHIYTVDEHILQVIDNLYHIEQGHLTKELPLATELFPQLPSKRLILLAALMHDIAKGRGGNHESRGEAIARKIGKRLGLDEDDVDTLAWLTRNHLIFSQTAFKRDLSDPATIEQFVEKVQRIDRLRYLLVLTVADIRAVGPSVWNQWKGQLMRELYNKAAESMGACGTDDDTEMRIAAIQSAITPLLDALPEDWQHYLAHMPNHYWLSFDVTQHQQWVELLAQIDPDTQPWVMQPVPAPLMNDQRAYALCLPSQHALFAQICGAFARTNLSIQHANIYTLPFGYTLMRIGHAPCQQPQEQLHEELEHAIGHALSQSHSHSLIDDGNHSVTDRKRKFFNISPIIRIDNMASRDATVIDITARDHIGLLYRTARLIAEAGMLVSSAHISTYGEKAVDVFYITDLMGQKIADMHRITDLKRALRDTLRKHHT